VSRIILIETIILGHAHHPLCIENGVSMMGCGYAVVYLFKKYQIKKNKI